MRVGRIQVKSTDKAEIEATLPDGYRVIGEKSGEQDSISELLIEGPIMPEWKEGQEIELILFWRSGDPKGNPVYRQFFVRSDDLVLMWRQNVGRSA